MPKPHRFRNTWHGVKYPINSEGFTIFRRSGKISDGHIPNVTSNNEHITRATCNLLEPLIRAITEQAHRAQLRHLISRLRLPPS
jgi:hypothetical protein